MKNQLHSFDEHDLASLLVNQVKGRDYRSGKNPFTDFTGTNYLAFDLNTEFQEKGIEYAKEWGPLWGSSRLEVDLNIYPKTEQRINQLLGSKRIHLSHTITSMFFSIMPAVAKKGLIVLDEKVHPVVYESARLARDHGATLARYKHQDIASLEKILKENEHLNPKVIGVDGVFSLSTEIAPVHELQALAEKYQAWLFIDDAHGFGIYGKNPTHSMPYGLQGTGVVPYFSGNYKRTFYVASFGKAFCTHTSFTTSPDEYMEPLEFLSLGNIFSAPVAPYTIGLVNGALDLNEKLGTPAREKLFQITQLLVQGLKEKSFDFENVNFFPVVFIKIGPIENVIPFAKNLITFGVHCGLRAYPVVPPNECGVRIALTAAHEPHHIEHLIEALSEARDACK